MVFQPKTVKLAVMALLVCSLGVQNSGCANSTDRTIEPDAPVPLKRIVVMPFQNMMQLLGKHRTVRGPITKKVFVTGDVAPKAELAMDRDLRELLAHEKSIKWVQLKAEDSIQLSVNSYNAEYIKKIQRFGRQQKADAVLAGYIYAYREREGGDFGAKTPASVAFELALVQVESGAVLWWEGFAETQRALNENLLEIGKFIKRKGRWVTARDMSRNAMADMLKSFPWRHPPTAK